MNVFHVGRMPLVFGIAVGLAASAAQAEQVAGDAAAAASANSPDPRENPGTANESQDSGGIADIIVTAERRTTNVQRVASAVSVRSGEDLRQQGKYSLNQILENVPGVGGVTSTGLAGLGSDSPETGIAIRGIKANGTGQGLPQSSTTAVYVDGVYSGVGGTYDIDRVEVLRGPQGTLYGRSATGGVIATYTRNPDLERVEGNGLVEIGNYGLRHYQAAVGAPLIDGKLGIRVSGDDYRLNGYIVSNGSGSVSTQNLRVKVLAEPVESVSVLLGFALTNTDSGAGGVTIRQTRTPYEFTYDRTTPLGATKQKLRQYWAQVDWDLGGIKLSYLPALREYSQAGTAPMVGPGGQILIQTVNAPFDKFFTHEVHLTSDTDSPFSWQIGGISFNNTARDYLNNIRWLDSGALATRREQDRKITDLGAFAEATYAFSESTRLTGGVRYDETKVRTSLVYTQNLNRTVNQGRPNVGLPENNTTITLTGDQGKADFTNFNYKARLEQDLAPGHLVYAGVSTGFIPGDLQIASTTPPTFYRYKAEKLTAYEAGSKNRFFDGKVQANVAGYFYDYGGFQQTIMPNIADSLNIIFISQRARMYGGEFELIARPTRFDQFDFNVSHITAHWVKTTPAFRLNVAEKTIFGIVPWKASAAYSHNFVFAGGSEVRFRGELVYQGAYQQANLTAANLAAGFKPYTYLGRQFLGNLNLDWTSSDKRFGLTAYVRNVGDNVYPTGVSLQTLTATTVTGTSLLTAPRTFGVIGRVNF